MTLNLLLVGIELLVAVGSTPNMNMMISPLESQNLEALGSWPVS